MLGAVFGAYAGVDVSQGSVREIGDDPQASIVLGVIGGAVVATTYNELQSFLEASSLSWREWSEAE